MPRITPAEEMLRKEVAKKVDRLMSLTGHLIRDELAHAILKHGPMPKDPFHCVSILTEEVGEVAAELQSWWNDSGFDGGTTYNKMVKASVVKELAQVACVAIRMIDLLENEDWS